MSVLETLQDDWRNVEQDELLGALTELVEEIGGSALTVEQVVTGQEVTQRLEALHKHGWFEFVVDEGTGPALYCEAVKRLHRRLVPAQIPLLETFAAARLLRDSADPAAAALLGTILSGERVLVLDLASLMHPRTAGCAGGAVPFGDTLSSLVVVAEGAEIFLHVVDPAETGTTPAPLVDPTLPAVRLEGTGTRIAALTGPEWDRAAGETLVAQAAAFVGQSQALLNSTLEYLGVREQFDVPIGSFQALRHRAADVAADVYAAQQLSIHLAETLEDALDRRHLGLLGRSLCGRAAVKASSEAVQLRGGMGFTWEDGTHLGLKRIMSLALTGGSLEDTERELGSSIIGQARPRWAGGLDNA